MYAIVDIETTGGFAAENAIIEIAVALHDGKKVTGWYETLINPGRKIPPYISGFTGISDEMVSEAPSFKEIAYELFGLLKDRVFVAHNVNFDYSFIQRAFEEAGIPYHSKRLCTVRLSRKIIPGFKSYSLGNLCQQLGIILNNAHRAGGDTKATAELFTRLLSKDQEGHIQESLKRNSGELNLPPNLDKKKFTSLPDEAGVYYFHDAQGKVIYVGKAKNVKKRVASHFSGNNSSEKKQNFLREIYDVSFELCGNELVALLLEAQEIKRLWPRFNRAQKTLDLRFGIYDFEDGNGILNLGIDKARKYFKPRISFASMWEARSYMDQLVRKHSLEKAYCGLEKFDIVNGLPVKGKSLKDKKEIQTYNKRVIEAIEDMINSKESFALLGTGRSQEEQSLVLVHEGRYYGYTFLEKSEQVEDPEVLLERIQPAREHNENYWLIRSYLQRNVAAKVIRFN